MKGMPNQFQSLQFHHNGRAKRKGRMNMQPQEEEGQDCLTAIPDGPQADLGDPDPAEPKNESVGEGAAEDAGIPL